MWVDSPFLATIEKEKNMRGTTPEVMLADVIGSHSAISSV